MGQVPTRTQDSDGSLRPAFWFRGQEPLGLTPLTDSTAGALLKQEAEGPGLSSSVADINFFCLHSICFEAASLYSLLGVTLAWWLAQVLGAMEGGCREPASFTTSLHVCWSRLGLLWGRVWGRRTFQKLPIALFCF